MPKTAHSGVPVNSTECSYEVRRTLGGIGKPSQWDWGGIEQGVEYGLPQCAARDGMRSRPLRHQACGRCRTGFCFVNAVEGVPRHRSSWQTSKEQSEGGLHD